MSGVMDTGHDGRGVVLHAEFGVRRVPVPVEGDGVEATGTAPMPLSQWAMFRHNQFV